MKHAGKSSRNFIAMLFPLRHHIRHIQQRYIHSIIPSIEMLCPRVHAFEYPNITRKAGDNQSTGEPG